MKSVIAALAVAIAIVTLSAASTDARASRIADRWGCHFEAKLALIYETPKGHYWWIGAGVISCEVPQKLVVRMVLLKDTPGTPDRVISQDTWVFREGPHYDYEDAKLPGGECKAGVRPRYPTYFRMQIEAKGLPGAVWVATPNDMNPCPEGQWPRYQVPSGSPSGT